MIESKTTRIRGAYCLGCGKTVDATTCLFERATPSPGDVTVCIYCGHVMIFKKHGRKLTLANPNTEQIHRMAGDPRIIALQRARHRVMHERGML